MFPIDAKLHPFLCVSLSFSFINIFACVSRQGCRMLNFLIQFTERGLEILHIIKERCDLEKRLTNDILVGKANVTN